MKNIVFLSGLPRTGSTVLASMLSQHPDIHATTTSPVADLLNIVLENWGPLSGALVDRHPGQLGGIVTGLVQGAYSHRQEGTILDKNRLWPRYARQIYGATGVKPKIVCTVRDIPSIMASYILLLEQNMGDNFVDRAVVEAGLPVNTKNRCRILLERFIHHPHTSLKIGHNSGAAEILYITYDQITGASQETVDTVCDFIGCSRYILDPGNLAPMPENDEFHGGLRGLHDIRQQLSRTSPPPADVLGMELVEYYTNMRLDFWTKPAKPLQGVQQPLLSGSTGQTKQAAAFLEGDSLDYDLLYRAAVAAAQAPGLYCEIGVRRGGSLRYIIDAIHDLQLDETRTVVAIDPYGNIDYNATQAFRGRLDYTNDMKNESLPEIYSYVNRKGINLVFHNLEDTEFFDRYGDGVPVYDNIKSVQNTYAFVFFDGPHDVDSINREVDFFMGRISPGSVFVFDDIATYPHNFIHGRLLDSGFEVLEEGLAGRKISYKYTQLNKSKFH